MTLLTVSVGKSHRQYKRSGDSVTLEELMFKILEHSCGNPIDYEEWVACGQDSRKYTGWNQYVIETHCTLWNVVAKKVSGQWIIKEAKPEDC